MFITGVTFSKAGRHAQALGSNGSAPQLCVFDSPQFPKFLMYSVLLLYLLVVPSLADRLHDRMKLARDVADVGDTDPREDYGKKRYKWLQYFADTEGLGYSPAFDKAEKVLAADPPDLDDVKKWADYFASGSGEEVQKNPVKQIK